MDDEISSDEVFDCGATELAELLESSGTLQRVSEEGFAGAVRDVIENTLPRNRPDSMPNDAHRLRIVVATVGFVFGAGGVVWRATELSARNHERGVERTARFCASGPAEKRVWSSAIVTREVPVRHDD